MEISGEVNFVSNKQGLEAEFQRPHHLGLDGFLDTILAEDVPKSSGTTL